MTADTLSPANAVAQSNLCRFYFIRAGFAVIWIALVAIFAGSSSFLSAMLLVAYPAWDALANLIDARGGDNRSSLPQYINAAISIAAAVLIALALSRNAPPAIVIFGGWAVLAGLIQLAVGVRRWRAIGGQWPMVLSGAQSMLIGGVLINRAMTQELSITALIPYAAFGALYFMLSALWLTWVARRTRVRA